MNTKKKASLMMLTSCLIWSLSYGVTKIALGGMSPALLTGLSFLLASVILAIVYNKRLKYINKELFYDGLILGAMLGIATVLFAKSMVYLSEAEGTIFESMTIPFVPIILLIFMRQKVSKKKIVCTAAAFFGILFLTYNGESFNLGIGAIYGLIAAVGFALHIIVSDKDVRKEDEIDLLIVQFFLAGIISLIFAFTFEDVMFVFKPIAFAAFVFLALIENVVSYTLQFKAEKILDSAEIGILHAGLPIFGLMSAVIFFGNRLSLKEMIGSSIIVLAIAFMEYEPKKKKEEENIAVLENS